MSKMTFVEELKADVFPWPNNVKPACQGHENPELWFPYNEEDLAEAQSFCVTCPVRMLCYQVAQARGEEGVWGGELLAKGQPTPLPYIVRKQQEEVKAAKRRVYNLAYNERRRSA